MLKRVPVVVWIAVAAAALWAAFANTYPWFDTIYSLEAAQDLLAGRDLGYSLPNQPAYHPLMMLISLICAPFGAAALYMIVALGAFAFAALCYGVLAYGRLGFGPAVGAIAALLIFTSVALESMTVRAYGDVFAAALVVFALLLELERPRRGWQVLALLAAAGLQRPEAWFPAAAYWLYLCPRRSWRERIGLAALVASAPLLWYVSESLLIGSQSSAGAANAAVASAGIDLRHGLDLSVDLPGYVSALTRKVVAVGGVVGAFCAVVWWRRRSTWLALATAALTIAALVALKTANQQVVARYAFVVAVILGLFCAVAAVGWIGIGRHAGRNLYRLIGVATIALLLVTLPNQIDHWREARAEIMSSGGAWNDLRSLVTSRTVRARFASCKPILVPSYNPVPYLRLVLNVPAGDVIVTPPASTDRGLIVVPRIDAGTLGFLSTGPGDGTVYSTTRPSGSHLIAANRSWQIFAGRGCPG